MKNAKKYIVSHSTEVEFPNHTYLMSRDTILVSTLTVALLRNGVKKIRYSDNSNAIKGAKLNGKAGCASNRRSFKNVVIECENSEN